MQLLFLMLSGLLSFAPPVWLHDMNHAKEISKESHKQILLNFSGSDWCGPCIKLEREIFENQAFQTYADQHLVLVNADFPRLKKNQLDPIQKGLNEKLAEKYNKDGIFPLTLLLDADGKVVKKWVGIPAKDPQNFISLLQTAGK